MVMKLKIIISYKVLKLNNEQWFAKLKSLVVWQWTSIRSNWSIIVGVADIGRLYYGDLLSNSNNLQIKITF